MNPRSFAVRCAGAGLALALIACTRAAAADPDYPHGQFTDDCRKCHAPERWSPARIDKAFRHPDSFALRGAHAAAPCRGCHLALDFSKTPTACADCHKDVHRGELGTDCARCHVPLNFLDRSKQLDDHRATRFPLTGVHVSLDCAACHRPQPQGALTWVGLSTQCATCHLAEYQATTDPDHEAAGFPRDCSSCHTPTTWNRARFDHAGTAFPLTGAHRAVACQACHASGYQGTPTDCYACHQADYQGTTDPNHAASGFPTTCATCHATTSWEGAGFPDHDARFFPIYSGRHRGVWSTCSECHTQAGSFATYTCFPCHDQPETDRHHAEVSGYSHDCVQCHRDGRQP